MQVSNEWDILFSGRILSDKDTQKKIEFIQIDAVVESSEGDIIYCGLLKEFRLNKTQGLDKIYLFPVYRRMLNQDLSKPTGGETYNVTTTASPIYDTPIERFTSKGSDQRYYQMPGHYFIIPYSQIKNINVTYLTFEKEEKKENS